MSVTIPVAAEHPYQVHIGAGVLAQAVDLVAGASRAAVIHPVAMSERAHHLARVLQWAGTTATCIEVPEGEQAKTGEVLLRCWDELAAAGLTRSDVVIGMGGGATTDLAGFVAASWLRGVAYLSIPTTVLAMVDAAVGGKTGINIPAGKNLVGAFHEPVGVLCDLDLLVGLPRREVTSGMAEIIKCGFIRDPRILELVEADVSDATDVTSVRFAELVRRAIQVKATVVTDDLREQTSSGDEVGREALNYGHTLGHAIEAHQHFTWRHGEAISIGMVFLAEVSQRALGLPREVVDRHRRILAGVGLPVAYDGADWQSLRATMSLDKKARGNSLRLVALREVGQVTILDDPDEEILLEAWHSLDPSRTR